MEARQAEQAGDQGAIIGWLQAFGRASGARDAEVGRWLLAAERTRAFVVAGAASVFELAERLIGWEPRTTYERLRVARALEELPLAAARLEAGELHWSKVREVTRVATPETEALWLEQAGKLSVRGLEQEVKARRPGDVPDDPPDPALVRQTVRMEFGAEGVALWRQAMDLVRKLVDPKLTPEQVIEHLLRTGIVAMQQPDEGERRPARPTHQVTLMVCAGCKQGYLVAGGSEVPAPNSVVERGLCDHECLGFPDPAAERLAVAHVDKAALPKSLAAHVGTGRVRTSRGIPPHVARLVRLRDKDACQVPGCRNRLFTELHHIEMWSDGGPNSPDNLLVLCGTHHQLLHDGRMWIEGSPPGGLVFRHADGTVYGTRLQPDALEANHAAFAALRGMGFREKDVRFLLRDGRRALERAGVPQPSDEQLVEMALRLSRRGAAASGVREEEARYEVSCPRGQSRAA